MNNVTTSITQSIGLIASNEDQSLPSLWLSDIDIDHNSIKFSCFETKEIKIFNIIVKIKFLFK
jgi:hypothetical protein